MRLFYSKASPFSSKVRMSAHHCGIEIEAVATDTNAEPADLLAVNPLGKIPALVLDDGQALFDSAAICEYFDRSSGNLLIPQTSAEWLQAKRMEALADGIADAAILTLYEKRYRPAEKQDEAWVDRQWRKAFRAMTVAEGEIDRLPDALHVGHFALAATLGWLRLRCAGTWEGKHPGLLAWLERFPEHFPAFEELGPRG